MNEPTVQVPVSLIEEAAWVFQVTGRRAMENKFRALLSQPTPSAEPVSAAQLLRERAEADPGSHRASLARGYGVGDAPPRIEDMAPGTTFRAAVYGGRIRAFTTTDSRIMAESEGGAYAVGDIDPSTIRDVTPPREDS